MMCLIGLEIKQLTYNIEEYYMRCRYGNLDLGISFLYHNNYNIIIPDHIFFRDIRTLCGGIIYKNSKEEIYEKYINSWRENFPELSMFSDMILKYIDKYCGIYNPEIICDLDKVEVNL